MLVGFGRGQVATLPFNFAHTLREVAIVHTHRLEIFHEHGRVFNDGDRSMSIEPMEPGALPEQVAPPERTWRPSESAHAS